jgi:hypothetical protein
VSRADDAWEALQDLLERVRPSCRNDARFIQQHPPRVALAAICQRCPVRNACTKYAKAARPEAGFWAGRGDWGRV